MFSSFLALLERYPAAWSFVGPILLLVVWAIVSGLFNLAYDKLSPHSDPEWAAALQKHPKWAAIVSVFKTGGINIPGWLRSLRIFFGGPPPAPIAMVVGGTRPPTVVQMREAMLEVAREQVREENRLAVERYATPLVGVGEAPPGPDLGVVTDGFLPAQPGDRALPEPPPTPRESNR
jgi:hypothetical protein